MKIHQYKSFLNRWAPAAVPAFSYILTTAMIVGAGVVLAGSALVAVLFGEWTLAGFGFLGAAMLGGQGVLGLLRQLNMSYGRHTVAFQPTTVARERSL